MTGTPYINHPLGVAWSLSEEGGVKDVETLQAAMLHEYLHPDPPCIPAPPNFTICSSLSTVEDTDTTFEELEREFGIKVAAIVREVTDDKSLAKDVRTSLSPSSSTCTHTF
jgi:guanosine-3',5'-bis(diphosphate) 3'-pyrophosphohydrolase